jgi:hypothetical protein
MTTQRDMKMICLPVAFLLMYVLYTCRRQHTMADESGASWDDKASTRGCAKASGNSHRRR